MNSDLAPIHQYGIRSHRSHRRLTVVALHDGAASSLLITHARTQIETLLGGTRRVMFFSWAFHHLEALDVRAMAAHLAEEAPLILIACASGHVPAHVERWLDSSLVEQGDLRALLVALDDQRGPLCTYTGRLASRWSTEHLCCSDLEAAPHRQQVIDAVEKRLLQESHDEGDDETSSTFDEAPPPPPPAKAPAAMPGIITEPKLREEIRMRAYHLWLHAGRPDGRELDFWLNAEREFLERQSASSAPMAEHW